MTLTENLNGHVRNQSQSSTGKKKVEVKRQYARTYPSTFALRILPAQPAINQLQVVPIVRHDEIVSDDSPRVAYLP